MIGWLFTPGRRWFQLVDLALGIAEDIRVRRWRRRR